MIPRVATRDDSGSQLTIWIGFIGLPTSEHLPVIQRTKERQSQASYRDSPVSNQRLPILHIDTVRWLQAFRDITNATNERTLVGQYQQSRRGP